MSPLVRLGTKFTLCYSLKNEPWQNIPSGEKSGSWESNHMWASLFMDTFFKFIALFWTIWTFTQMMLLGEVSMLVASQILIRLLGIHGRIWRKIGVLFDLFRGNSDPQYINNVHLSWSKRFRECLSLMDLRVWFHDGWEWEYGNRLTLLEFLTDNEVRVEITFHY